MLDSNNIREIKKIVEEFFQKVTIPAKIEVDVAPIFQEEKNPPSPPSSLKLRWARRLRRAGEEEMVSKDSIKTININIRTDDPQILIGEHGQTLLEIQRLLKIILNKQIKKFFYLNLDINDYKKKKIEYLKNLAKDLANEVSLTKEEKILLPMSSYERRIIHIELAGREDITTESQGEGIDRHIVIKPR